LTTVKRRQENQTQKHIRFSSDLISSLTYVRQAASEAPPLAMLHRGFAVGFKWRVLYSRLLMVIVVILMRRKSANVSSAPNWSVHHGLHSITCHLHTLSRRERFEPYIRPQFSSGCPVRISCSSFYLHSGRIEAESTGLPLESS
jgi:hypothetical protein